MAVDQEYVRSIAGRVVQSLGLELVDVELRGGGKSRMLRVVIDKPVGGGVTHEDCAQVSRELGTILDVEDAVPGGPYTLEISSPGLERKLTTPADYERFAGRRVKVTTRLPVNGNRYFEGRLESFREGRVTLDLSAGRGRKRARQQGHAAQVEIELENVERANLVPEF